MEVEKLDWLKQYVFMAERCKLLFKCTLPEMESLLVDHLLQENGVNHPQEKARYVRDRMAAMQNGGEDLMIEAAVAYANCLGGEEI